MSSPTMCAGILLYEGQEFAGSFCDPEKGEGRVAEHTAGHWGGDNRPCFVSRPPVGTLYCGSKRLLAAETTPSFLYPSTKRFQTFGAVLSVFSSTQTRLYKPRARFSSLEALLRSHSAVPGRSVSQVRELRSTFPPHSTMQTCSRSRGNAWNRSESTAATPTPAVGSISSFILSHTSRVARCRDRAAAVIPAARTGCSRAGEGALGEQSFRQPFPAGDVCWTSAVG